MRWGGRPALRRAVPLALVALAVVAAVLIAGPPPRGGPPLDPTNTGPAGTKALVDVLDTLGTRVRLTDAVAPGDSVALLLDDRLDEAAFADLQDWVRAGGTLVVADPVSRFTPDIAGPAGIGPLETSLARVCELPALADADRVAAPGGVVYELPGPDAAGCFPRGDGHWLVSSAEQAGTVVALGGPGALTNAALGEADNAVLAAALLAAERDGPLAFLRPAGPGAGDADLGDLVAERVWLALAQLGVAFGIVVAWRARRLGAPVGEPQPVQIAGSELVTAVGNLLAQTRARGQAARLLRADLRRELAERLGLPADSPPEAVAAAAVRRTGGAPDGLVSLLAGEDPVDEEGLVELAADLERARRAALAPIPHEEPARVP